MSVINLLDTLLSIIDNGALPKWRTSTQRARLFQPDLHKLAPAISDGLKKNFKSVFVEVVKCPDLRQWGNLSAKGICGNTRLIDAGGVPFMFDPEMQSSVRYHISDLLNACDVKSGLAIGAGAADPKIIGKNAELIPNLRINAFHSEDNHDDETSNNTHFAKMVSSQCFINNKEEGENDGDDVAVCRSYKGTSCGCLCNLFVSDGHNNNEVLHISVKQRIGDLNFTNCIRSILQKFDGVGGDRQIGMGGVIRVKKGKIRGHVMPDFMKEKVDVMDPKQIAVDEWLYFYECGPDLVMMCTMISGDPTEKKNMHLRVEHTHFYSLRKGVNEGGHYHYDTTAEEIEYEAYLNTAEWIYRVDDAFQFNLERMGGADNFNAELIK